MKMAWYFVQTLMGCIGSVGFAVLFNIRGRKLLLAAGGGALAWAVYLACTCNGLDIFAGLFFATLAAALASELLARAVKAPVIMLLVPMLIPLIPGGDLYYMMSFLVRGQYEAFGQYAQRVLTEAGAIALGIICCGVAHEYHRGPACAGAGRQIERFRVCRSLKKPSVSCMIKGIFRMRYKHAGRENAMKIMAVDYGDARTGLAVCDRTEFLASPIGIIEEKSLAKVAEKNRVRQPRI